MDVHRRGHALRRAARGRRSGGRSPDVPDRDAADVRDDIDTSPYGRGLKAIAYGFAYLHGKDDHTKIALESPMYDALYAFCQQQAAHEATS